jgi:hypothetical protein
MNRQTDQLGASGRRSRAPDGLHPAGVGRAVSPMPACGNVTRAAWGSRWRRDCMGVRPEAAAVDESCEGPSRDHTLDIGESGFGETYQGDLVNEAIRQVSGPRAITKAAAERTPRAPRSPTESAIQPTTAGPATRPR